MASKFLLLQESVRDAADLYLSLKYPPVLLVNDTPCGFARHLDIREPSLTKHLWGDCLGCFQKPDPDMVPKEVQDEASFKLTAFIYLNSLSLLFKGLGHAVLGNFSTDQIVIELTKITY